VTRVEHARVATGGKDDWRTPDVLLDRVRRIDAIGLDPCADSNPTNHFARRNFTAEDDGLVRSWYSDRGLTFVNWAYSQSAKWVDKIIAEAAEGVPIVGLGAARPGCRWYRKAKAHCDAIAEWNGRITFVGASTGAPFPSALFAFNVSWRRFAAAFADVATIEVPTLATAPIVVPRKARKPRAEALVAA
jgi:hypothetical protein